MPTQSRGRVNSKIRGINKTVLNNKTGRKLLQEPVKPVIHYRAKKYQTGFDSKTRQQGVHASLGKTSHQRGHSVCEKAIKTRIASYGSVDVIFHTRVIN